MHTSPIEIALDAVASMATVLRKRGVDPELVRKIEAETLYRLTELMALDERERMIEEAVLLGNT